MTKIEALAKYLEVDPSELNKTIDEDVFQLGRKEYLVLTDSEADVKARDYILDSLWSFNAWFISCHALPGFTKEIIEMIQSKHEESNDAIKNVIKDIDHFVDDAIKADGRGHFMNTYDGEEHESGEYFIYRIN